MTEDVVTFEELHAQVRDALLSDPRPPRGVRLGAKQVDAILAYHRAAAGTDDVGPLTEFAGVPVLASRSADRLAVEYEGDAAEAAEAPPAGG